ncbi:MAG: 3-oxoacyl-ACP reductase [Ignavibacteriales bacterium CG12_big_fil_rev_8_21_14_0_65_30_8]|nr:MAG: 3-oxoacyl-ACP reductase [Ignavibacteriales bacterium CG12_big_fil_rev_8_21_14_0_65_30_8]
MSERRLAVVTGANRGIGRAIALKLAKENNDVIIFGRDVEALKKVKNEILDLNVNCEYYSGDVNDVEFVNNSINKILADHKKIDILINNAGMGIFKKFVDSNLEDFKKQMDVNIYGVYNFTKAVINQMIERRNGYIINISSLAGKNSFATGTMYAATKHALMGFTRSLMLEVREFDVKVAAVCPGSVDTEFFSGHRNDNPKILQSDDIAEAVSVILKLPKNALISEIDIRPSNP